MPRISVSLTLALVLALGLASLGRPATIGAQNAPGIAPPSASGGLARTVKWTPRVDYAGDFFPAAALAYGPVKRLFDGSPRMVGLDKMPTTVTPRSSSATPVPGVGRFRVASMTRQYVGDGFGLLGAEITLDRVPALVRLVVDAPDFAMPSSIDVMVTEAGITYEIFPEMLYVDAKLKQIGVPTVSNIAFRLTVNDSLVGEHVERVQVRAVTDIPISYRTAEGTNTSQPWLFAAYVNEYHPSLDPLLREALATGVITAFTGYQVDAQGVLMQVFAIWNALQRRGIRYSTVATAVPTAAGVFSQNVRPLDESLQSSQANCVDGSVLFASALRRIGIDPILILVPGHMFVGYYEDARHQRARFIETTLLGATDLRGLPADGSFGGDLNRLFGGDTRNTASGRAFDYAMATASQRYNTVLPMIRAGQNPQYQLIDIAAIRKTGMAPAR